MKKIFFYIFLILFTVSQGVFANTSQGYALYVPTGAKVSAVLSQDINSKTATVGQNISAILTEDFKYKDQLVASSGSVLIGSVVKNRKAGLKGQDAQMLIRFTTIRTLYNNLIPISAVIVTDDLTGVLKAEAKGDSEFFKSIKIPSDTRINIIFDQPITLGAQ